MRALCGEVNDSCYLSFQLEGAGNNDLWEGEKTIIRGSNSFSKGKFRSTKGNVVLQEKAYLKYKDVTNSVVIVFTESKLAPLSRIRIGLPNPDKYNVSEFFVKGYLEIERIDVISAQKTVGGETVMVPLKAGKRINLLDKLFFERLGEPLIKVDSLETAFGTIEQIKAKINVEI